MVNECTYLIRVPLLVLVVVLVLSFELYEAGRDVVEADHLSVDAWGKGVAARLIEELDAILHLLFISVFAVLPLAIVDFSNNVLACILVAFLLSPVPDTITGQNNELNISAVKDLDFRLAADHLRKRIQLAFLLKFEVAEGARNRKRPLNSATINEATCSFYPFLLPSVVWFVIVREILTRSLGTILI